MITSEEKSLLKDTIISFVKEIVEQDFDYYVKEGWFILTSKTLENVKGKIVTENFKNGKEFGIIFGRQLELKLEDWFRSF